MKKDNYLLEQFLLLEAFQLPHGWLRPSGQFLHCPSEYNFNHGVAIYEHFKNDTEFQPIVKFYKEEAKKRKITDLLYLIEISGSFNKIYRYAFDRDWIRFAEDSIVLPGWTEFTYIERVQDFLRPYKEQLPEFIWMESSDNFFWGGSTVVEQNVEKLLSAGNWHDIEVPTHV